MRFSPTAVAGCYLVALEPHHDERGFFARTWCVDEFASVGLNGRMVQSSLSRNSRAGTLRGLHFSAAPSEEAKLVRCSRGRIFDVVVDLRPSSPSYLQCDAVVLDAGTGDAMYVPPGVAHGFQTLADDCDVIYAMTEAYQPALARGVRFDDPCFGIAWPRPVTVIHERDCSYLDWAPSRS